MNYFKTKLSYNIFLTALVIYTLFSCGRDEFRPEETNEVSTQTQKRFTEGVIPFTVENVNEALSNVLDYYNRTKPEVAQRFQNYQVKTTHIYYKFTPQDSLQAIALLEYEEEFQLTTTPFEYDSSESTEDSEENEIPIFYAIVENGFSIPNVPNEIIAELHFTDEERLEDEPSNYDEIEFKQNLMYEAMKLAGRLDDEELAEGYLNYEEDLEEHATQSDETGNVPLGLFGKRWRPSGTVYVEDDWLSEKKGSQIKFPVVRVRVNVLIWGWLRVTSGYTDYNGNFSCGKIYTKHIHLHYNVKFTDSYKVKVRPGNFFDIAHWKSDSHKKRSLNVTFVKYTRHQFYALINNAAWDYFNRVVPVYGIYNPYTIEISGHYNGKKSDYWFDWVPFRSEVKIGGRYGDGSRKRSDAIYATVIHEMTHKSHYKMDWKAFSGIAGNGAKHKLFLRESWAICVETITTNDKYGQYFSQYGIGDYVASISYYGQINRKWKTYKQYETVAEMNEYSPVFIDLIDNINQKNLSYVYPEDRVSGYTLKQIQTALNGSYTIGSFGNKLKSLYNNPTKQFIDDVINYSQTVVDGL